MDALILMLASVALPSLAANAVLLHAAARMRRVMAALATDSLQSARFRAACRMLLDSQSSLIHSRRKT